MGVIIAGEYFFFKWGLVEMCILVCVGIENLEKRCSCSQRVLPVVFMVAQCLSSSRGFAPPLPCWLPDAFPRVDRLLYLFIFERKLHKIYAYFLFSVLRFLCVGTSSLSTSVSIRRYLSFSLITVHTL